MVRWREARRLRKSAPQLRPLMTHLRSCLRVGDEVWMVRHFDAKHDTAAERPLRYYRIKLTQIEGGGDDIRGEGQMAFNHEPWNEGRPYVLTDVLLRGELLERWADEQRKLKLSSSAADASSVQTQQLIAGLDDVAAIDACLRFVDAANDDEPAATMKENFCHD